MKPNRPGVDFLVISQEGQLENLNGPCTFFGRHFSLLSQRTSKDIKDILDFHERNAYSAILDHEIKLLVI